MDIEFRGAASNRQGDESTLNAKGTEGTRDRIEPDIDCCAVDKKSTFAVAVQRPRTKENTGCMKSANPASFLKWFPFPFGSNNISSSKHPHTTSSSKKDNTTSYTQMMANGSSRDAMPPSPDQQWMSTGELQMNPDMVDIMRSILSDPSYDDNSMPSNERQFESISQWNVKADKDAQTSSAQTRKDVGNKQVSIVASKRGKRTNKKHRSCSRQSAVDENLKLAQAHCSNHRRVWGCRIRSSSPPPEVRNINGKKVTIVDDNLKVFVADLLSPETCTLVRTMADDHVRQVHENGNRVPTWRTLYTYTKQDLPCSEVENLCSLVTDSITASVKEIVGEIFGKQAEASQLRERSWKEPHLLLYQHIEGKPIHTGVEMHYDGCDVTWICMLSSIDEYTGGGTYIRALRKNIKLQQGQVLIFPGELYHKGCDIRSGVRAMAVCFLDGFPTNVTDPSSPNTDRVEWQENDRIY